MGPVFTSPDLVPRERSAMGIRLSLSPIAWVGLANVVAVTSSLVLVLRHRYVSTFVPISPELPSSRLALVVAIGGLAVLLLRNDRWGVIASVGAVALTLALVVRGLLDVVAGVPRYLQLLKRPRPVVWEGWTDVPLGVECIVAASAASLCLVVALVVRVVGGRGSEERLLGDSRWWAACGSVSVLTISALSIVRLAHEGDVMRREPGLMGFGLLVLVAAPAFGVALLARRTNASWWALFVLLTAAAMCLGPLVVWMYQLQGLARPDLLGRDLVVEGLVGLVLGVGCAAAGVLCLLRASRQAR